MCLISTSNKCDPYIAFSNCANIGTKIFEQIHNSSIIVACGASIDKSVCHNRKLWAITELE